MAKSCVHDVPAIDVHAHFGPYLRGVNAMMDRFCSSDADHVINRARRSNVGLTIVSPLRALMPRGQADVLGGNEEGARIIPQHPELRLWVVLNPLLPASFDQARELIAHPWCAGIKIHPEEHLYNIADEGRKIFEFAARHRLIVITHSGEQRSRPEDFVPFADEFPEARLILAHLGCTFDGDPTHQVQAVRMSRRGNVFVDTSSSQNIIPGLLEWAVGEIGAEKLLFGTDSPLYFLPMQRARVDQAEMADEAKRRILRDNAAQLLGLNGK